MWYKVSLKFTLNKHFVLEDLGSHGIKLNNRLCYQKKKVRKSTFVNFVFCAPYQPGLDIPSIEISHICLSDFFVALLTYIHRLPQFSVFPVKSVNCSRVT